MESHLAGQCILTFSCLLFFYYTFWALILPFLDDPHIVRTLLFPDPKWVPAIPACMFVVGIGSLLIFAGYLFIEYDRRVGKMKRE